MADGDKHVSLAGLKAVYDHLDGNVSSLKSAFANDIAQITGNTPFVFTSGYYRVFNDLTVVDISAPERSNTTSQTMVTTLIPCQPGEKYTIRAYGAASTAAAYGYLDSDCNGIYRNGASALVEDTLTVPDTITVSGNQYVPAWLIVNNNLTNNGSNYYAYKGKSLNADAFRRMGLLTSSDNLNNVTQSGWYYWTASSVPENRPAAMSSKMLVFYRTNADIVQIVYGRTSKLYGYIRAKTSDGWDTNWTKMVYFPDMEDAISNAETQLNTRIDKIAKTDIKALVEENKDENDKYTESFTVDIDLKSEPMILSAVSQYTGTGVPTIQVKTYNPNLINFVCPVYEFGGTVEPTRKSWRIPAAHSLVTKAHVIFTIPSGTEVTIREISLCNDQRNRYNDLGIKYHGHAGYIAPSNTLEAFQIAAELGYNSLITTPKFTDDGNDAHTAVCFHDDNSISGDLCWINGNNITGTDNKAISEYSYDYITQNFRIKGSLWGTQHVPKLDDYFRICSLTGMAPILSVHSSGLGLTYAAGFAIIRAMAEKWNVLNKLGIKSGDWHVQSAAREVFGTDIDCYIFINGSTHEPNDNLTIAKNAGFVGSSATDLTGCEYKLIAEYYYSQTVSGATYYTGTIAAMAADYQAGFKLSVASTGVSGESGAEMKRLITENHVTEFTVDNHISMGLDW